MSVTAQPILKKLKNYNYHPNITHYLCQTVSRYDDVGSLGVFIFSVPNGLSCVRYYAGILSKTHAKAIQSNAEMKDHFVDDTE